MEAPDSKSEITMRKILTAARKVLAENGYAETTISKISEEANVSRGLLHYHFKDKEDIVTKVLWTNMEKLGNLAFTMLKDTISADTFAELFVDSMEIVMEEDPHFQVLIIETILASSRGRFNREELNKMYTYYHESLAGVIEHLQKQNRITDSINAKEKATIIAQLIDGASLQVIGLTESAIKEIIYSNLKSTIANLLK